MLKKLSAKEIKDMRQLTENKFDDVYGQHNLYRYGTGHAPVSTEPTKAVPANENVKDKFFEMIKTASEIIVVEENGKPAPTCNTCGEQPKYAVELSNKTAGKEAESKSYDLCNTCYDKKLKDGFTMSGRIAKYRFR